MTLNTVAQQIRERHQVALTKRQAIPTIRDIEINWSIDNQQYHGMRMPAFTDREQGNVKYMIEQLGKPEVVFLMREAVEHWSYIREQKSLEGLPPTPTFGALFVYRETIRSFLHGRTKVQEKKISALEKLKIYEMEAKVTEKPKLSLLEMAKQAQKEYRDARK
jgi:hypothetical protein